MKDYKITRYATIQRYKYTAIFRVWKAFTENQTILSKMLRPVRSGVIKSKQNPMRPMYTSFVVLHHSEDLRKRNKLKNKVKNCSRVISQKVRYYLQQSCCTVPYPFFLSMLHEILLVPRICPRSLMACVPTVHDRRNKIAQMLERTVIMGHAKFLWKKEKHRAKENKVKWNKINESSKNDDDEEERTSTFLVYIQVEHSIDRAVSEEWEKVKRIKLKGKKDAVHFLSKLDSSVVSIESSQKNKENKNNC